MPYDGSHLSFLLLLVVASFWSVDAVPGVPFDPNEPSSTNDGALQRRLAWDKGTVRVRRGLDDAKAWSGKPFAYAIADDAFDGYVDRFKVRRHANRLERRAPANFSLFVSFLVMTSRVPPSR